MTTNTTTYLGITATTQEWRAVGLVPFSDGTRLSPSGMTSPEVEAELMQARAALPNAPGWQVLGEFARIHQARSEERTRSTALAREADAILALARAIRESAEEGVILDRIMPRLTERTRYAVRAQLGIHG